MPRDDHPLCLQARGGQNTWLRPAEELGESRHGFVSLGRSHNLSGPQLHLLPSGPDNSSPANLTTASLGTMRKAVKGLSGPLVIKVTSSPISEYLLCVRLSPHKIFNS